MTLSEILSNEELRQHEFPVTQKKIFLGHAAVCALPRRVAHGNRRLAAPDGLRLEEIGHISDLVARFAPESGSKKL